jgi:hypothetical protein
MGIFPGAVPYQGPARSYIISGAEHPELDVVLKSRWMTGALGSMPEKAPDTPPNDVKCFWAKPRAVTSVN